MEKLRTSHPILKVVLFVVLLAAGVWALSQELQTIGSLLTFASLVVLFEGFGFGLIIKILSAMGLGLGLSLANLKWTWFPTQYLIDMKPLGSVIFMNCLTMALVPLVFSSILTGVTSLGDLNKLSRIGIKTLVYYLATTALAISIGLFITNLVQPGKNISPEIKSTFIQEYSSTAQTHVTNAENNKLTPFQSLQTIFPKNILASVSVASPDMLQLIFFAIICGVALLKIDPAIAKPINDFFIGITEMTTTIVTMVMIIAPYGVFALIASTVALTKSTELLVALIPFSICVLIGLAVHVLGPNVFALQFLARKSPIEFFKTVKNVLVTAFSTSSSGATMPLTLKTVERDLGVRKEVSSFVIPLGATVNMDGTALYQGAAAIFLANVYDIPLTFADQLLIVAMATLASIGTAAVPGVSIVILTMILVSVNIPPEGILFLLPVNNLLDMFRTTVNVLGDMVCAVFIDSTETRYQRKQNQIAAINAITTDDSVQTNSYKIATK